MTDLKKKKKRYVYLDKFVNLSTEVQEQGESVMELRDKLVKLQIVVTILIIMDLLIFTKVLLG